MRKKIKVDIEKEDTVEDIVNVETTKSENEDNKKTKKSKKEKVVSEEKKPDVVNDVVNENKKVKKEKVTKDTVNENEKVKKEDVTKDTVNEKVENEEVESEELKILNQIKENKKLPKSVKKKMLSAIADCAISAIIAYVYFIFLELGNKNIHPNIYITDLRVFAVSLSIVSIVFFERAYRNKSVKEMFRGIEILVLAILTLFLQYIILYLTPSYRIFIPLFGVIFNIYYIFKTFVMCKNVKITYRRESNDIKEIIKKEKKI